jgi:hypothetical protein
VSQIEYRTKPSGKALEFAPGESEAVRRSTEVVRAWAEANGFETLTFWLEEGSANKLLVQLGDEPPLASWVDLDAVRKARVGDLEGQLDYARGEHRRRAAGYGQYDH